MPDEDRDLLSGVTVVQLGATPVGSAAGALLAVLGASVRILSPPAPPEAALRTHERDLLAALQNGSPVETVGDLFSDRLIATASKADIVVTDLSAAREVVRDGFVADYINRVRQVNSSAWVTVSGFGLESGRERYRATELTALASGGIPHYMRDASGRPLKPAGYTASLAAGHVAAVAGLYGLVARNGGGPPLHLDVSMQDTVIATGVFLECAHALFRSPGKSGMGRYSAPRGYFECKDGHIFVVVLEDHQWAGVVRALDAPRWTAGIVTNADRMANAERIDEELRAWARQRTAHEAAEILQSHGAPASPLNSCAALTADADFRESRFLRAVDGGSALLPGVPAVFTSRSPGAAPRPGRVDAGHGAKVRILDVGNVLAGPLATSWLGTMGFDVLKVEDPNRLDIYRRRGPFIEGGDSPEHGAYFAAANYSKRSCLLSLDTPAGRREFSRLVAESDFVIENLSASRAERLGLTAAGLDESDTTLISSSGFGRQSTKGHYRAYGQIIHSYGGITFETRDRDGEFRALGTSWADPLTSVWICALTLAELLGPRAARAHVDLSMVKVVARQLPEYFAAASSGDRVDSTENDLAGYSPHGIYRCLGEDSWLAVAVGTDDEWARLVDVLAEPTLSDRRFARLAGRLDEKPLLDRLLEEAVGQRAAEDLFVRLQEAGVACSPVYSATDLADSAALRTRGLIQVVHHPVWGEREVTGLPWRRVGDGVMRVSPTPTLGDASGY